ncbi:MAG: hypothetical protein GY866_26360 [Proteobacteria bacterium]|nr:hypothetical protein [Pseudomonadota bacterium]
MQKLNCWEFNKCGREGDDDVFEEVETCPSSTEFCTDGVNDGKNGGRACWAIVGTFCGDQVQSDRTGKFKSCMECDFFKLVKKEEGDKFVTGSELTERLLYKEKFLS